MEIEKLFKKSGWISIIESVIFLVLGIILIIWPNDIMKIISFVLGGFFILIGAYQVISYFLSGGKYDFYDNSLIYGIIIIVVGVVTLVYSETISSILRIIIGIWILYSSLIRMNLAFKLKSMELGVWGPSFILAGIMFICGMYITLHSGAIITTIGAMMIVSSVLDIIEDIIFMKNVDSIF